VCISGAHAPPFLIHFGPHAFFVSQLIVSTLLNAHASPETRAPTPVHLYANTTRRPERAAAARMGPTGRGMMLALAALWAIVLGADAWRWAGGAGRGVGGRRPGLAHLPRSRWVGVNRRSPFPFAGQRGGGLAAGDVGAAADGEGGDGNAGRAGAIKVGPASVCVAGGRPWLAGRGARCLCARMLALRLVADPRHMYIPHVSLPAAGVDANVWWLARELDGIKQVVQAQSTALEAKIQAQSTALEAKIQAQGTALEAKIQAQGTALEAKMEKQDERLAGIEKALVSWRINFAWVAAGFAGLEFVLANKEVIVGVLESIGQHK
jgi:hypothetical protein